MATNEIFEDGNDLSLPVPAGTKSGDPVYVGGTGLTNSGLVGFAQTDRNEGAAPDPIYNLISNDNPVGNASVDLDGVYEVTVAFAITNIGDPVFIKKNPGFGAAALVGTDAGDGSTPLFGRAITTKSATSGPLWVRPVQH